MAFPNAEMVEQPESNRIDENQDYIKVERHFKCKARYTRDQLIAGEYVPDANGIDDGTAARYVGYRWSPEIAYPVLIIMYVRRTIRTARYEYHGSGYESPLENNLNYLQAYKYQLYSKVADDSKPSWYGTAGDDSDTATDTDYYWSRTGAVGDYKYLVDVSASPGSLYKPGVVNYLDKTAVVTKRKVYDDYNLAVIWAGFETTYMAPEFTYGLSSDADAWLVRDVRILDDNGSWVVTAEFLYGGSGGWDTDIYQASGVADDA